MARKPELNFEDAILDQWSDSDLKRLERPLVSNVFWLVIVFSALIILLVVFRILALNWFFGDFYKKRSYINVNQEFIIPAHRGIISDRFGNQLVKNIPSFSVSINKSEFIKNRSEQNKLLKKLSLVLEIPEDDLKKIIKDTDLEESVKILLARNITLEQAIDLQGLRNDALVIEDDYKRDYVEPLVLSHILGYTGLIDWSKNIEGKTGLEDFYNDTLRGEDGAYIISRDAKGNALQKKIIRENKPGSQLLITVDLEFQKYFYERFRQSLQELERHAGTGIAMNPKTGEILALVSFPSFDNNNPVKYLRAPNQPLFNRAVSGTYSPGSTIKPLVALAGLKEKIMDTNFEVYSPGYLEIPNPYDPENPSRFLDWRVNGLVNLHSALARSSNVYFYVIGGGYKNIKGLRINKLNEYWKKFGLDKKTNIDLPNEAVGFLPNPEEKEKRTKQPWRIGDTYNVSIGQGDLIITPIRLLSMIASIANNGKMMKPHFLLNESPDVLFDYSDWGDLIKEVQQGMRDAVAKSYGTANFLYDLPYKTAGKTGSAQIANNTKTNAFFTGYGPVSDPQIAILILVEDAKGGSLNAVPIAKDVLKWYYDHRLN